MFYKVIIGRKTIASDLTFGEARDMVSRLRSHGHDARFEYEW